MLTMVLSACGSANTAEETPVQQETVAPDAGENLAATEPAGEDQIIKVAVSTDVTGWSNTAFANGDGRFVWAQVYETLVRLDEELNHIPGLATSWESEDDITWTFHLREGVKFHDGSDFNADAVIYSYGPETYVVTSNTLPVSSIEKIDDYTVQFVCTKACPLPTYLTHIAWPVMSPNNENYPDGAIGTGPYVLAEHSKGEEIVMERFDDYWGEGAKNAGVVFKVIPDAASRMMALTAGDVDMAIKVPETDVITLEQDKNITVHRTLTTFTDYLQFNTKKAPFDDVNVRRAVAHAIDTESIVANTLDGIGLAAQGRAYSPVMMYCSDELDLYTLDQDAARACLAEAGWEDVDNDGIMEKDGEELEISILVSQSWSPRESKIVQACQYQLSEVGFKVTINQVESAAASEIKKTGEFDINVGTGMFVWGPYPHHVKLHSSNNYNSFYSNPEYDALIAACEGTPDEEKPEIYRQIQQMILDEVPAYYIVHEEKIVATRSNVQGYVISAEDPWLNVRNITLG